jgi:hypothetical protein
MVSETHARPHARTAPGLWPPDDTEESVLGIDLHQTTIHNLRSGINELAAVHQLPDQPAPWHAITQLILTGCKRPDGTFIRTLPDVFVYPRSAEPYRGSWTLAVDGPPELIIEVLSLSTYQSDLDLVAGKGYSYAQAGVLEYLTLDPTGEFLPEQGRGWRLVDGVYQPWARDGEGRWQSQAIAAAFGVAGTQVSVYHRDGQRMPREGEVVRALAERDARLAENDAKLAEMAVELARLRRLAGEDAG